jgi:hypothetical protein
MLADILARSLAENQWDRPDWAEGGQAHRIQAEKRAMAEREAFIAGNGAHRVGTGRFGSFSMPATGPDVGRCRRYGASEKTSLNWP